MHRGSRNQYVTSPEPRQHVRERPRNTRAMPPKCLLWPHRSRRWRTGKSGRWFRRKAARFCPNMALRRGPKQAVMTLNYGRSLLILRCLRRYTLLAINLRQTRNLIGCKRAARAACSSAKTIKNTNDSPSDARRLRSAVHPASGLDKGHTDGHAV